MNKALLVFDQVSFAALARHVEDSHSVSPVRLDYLPRTTPVGHATISTGRTPAEHRIQGRRWHDCSGRAYEIDALVNRARPRRGGVFDAIRDDNLTRKLRAEGVRSVVIAAAKDFIPFLFGAWDADVSLYPKAVYPALFSSPGPFGGRHGFELVLDIWTQAGADAVLAAHNQIERCLGDIAATVPGSDFRMFRPALAVGGRPMYWAMPASWGNTLPRVLGEWRSTLPTIADSIDDFYTAVTLAIAMHLPEPRALLQSCFATDAAGHRDGPSSHDYDIAVAASVRRARLVHASGWSVGVVSDHGGRDTPNSWFHDQSTTPGSVSNGSVRHHLQASAAEVLSGDHVVGYGALPANGVMCKGLDAHGLLTVTVPTRVYARSFHRHQTPAWLILPPEDGTVAKRGKAVRGNHGASYAGTGLSDADNEVGCWSLPAASHPPKLLEEVATWFLTLP